jgi:enhancer of polycomb-like protein
MPRNHNPGASTLRNRNRVTNKTRLKIVHGNIDADPLVLDEDEEKARVISTAGVDAEDANVSPSSLFEWHFGSC